MTIPDSWLSVDPGDMYVGYCRWARTQCVESHEYSPEDFINRLETDVCLLDAMYYGVPQNASRVSLVVYERWALYAWNQKSLAGNEFKTSQLIGTLKYICLRAGVERVGQFASQGKSTYNRAPFKHWRARDWQAALNGNIGRGHTKDAYAHGAEFLRTRGWRPA